MTGEHACLDLWGVRGRDKLDRTRGDGSPGRGEEEQGCGGSEKVAGDRALSSEPSEEPGRKAKEDQSEKQE